MKLLDGVVLRNVKPGEITKVEHAAEGQVAVGDEVMCQLAGWDKSLKGVVVDCSEGFSTEPLFCEFLSPWVLVKEVQTMMVNRGIKSICCFSFRQKKPTVFWNLVLYFCEFNLPVTFLIGLPESERYKIYDHAYTNSENLSRSGKEFDFSEETHEESLRSTCSTIPSTKKKRPKSWGGGHLLTVLQRQL